jgi:predicted RNA binding protein YcfA (HicA-like mRNA interferase family)
MPKLPCVTAGQVLKAFEKAGFSIDRTTGSHHIMKKAGHRYNLSVPKHGSDNLATGTLRSLIRDSGLTVEQFTANL